MFAESFFFNILDFVENLTILLFISQLIDELNSYDGNNRRAWQHLWRLSETEFEYKFFTSTGHGIDTTTTLSVSIISETCLN